MLKKLLLVISLTVFSTMATFAQEVTPAPTTAKSAGTAKKPAVFRPTKAQIKEVQTMLIAKKLYSGEASGTYNVETRTGIKSFQNDNGLNPTGTLNRATLEKFGVELTENQKKLPVLESSFAGSRSAAATTDNGGTVGLSAGVTTSTAKSTGTKADGPKRPAPFRANAEQINAVQKMLKEGKMYDGEATGKLDDPTREGLKKYQDANSLKVTGTLNAATLEKMGVQLTEAQKANVAAQAAYDAARKN